MSEHVYLLTLGMPLLTVLLVFGMRSLSVMRQARLQHDSQEAYRELLEKSAAAQAQTAAALSSISASLADLSSRVAAIEKVLKEVE